MVNHETNELFFENLEIPAENLIGEEGQGFKYILDGLNAERTLIAAECIGDGYWFLDRVTKYVKRASRQAVPGGGSHCGGWRVAPTPLRCSIRGRAEELAAFAALTRSNSFGKHEDEARCARRPRLCAPRRHRDRPHRVPPAAKQRGVGIPTVARQHGLCKAACAQAVARL
jgi:hypothetical protein